MVGHPSINNARGGGGLELCTTDVRLKPTGKEVRRISPDMSASRQFHEPAESKPERYPGFLLRNPLRTTEGPGSPVLDVADHLDP